MDMLPQTIVGVRNPLRSAIYRVALQREIVGAFGFVLGTRVEWTRPVLEIPLLVAKTNDPMDLWDIEPPLQRHRAAAQKMAAETSTEILGLFIARDNDLTGSHRHTQMGLIMDTAIAMQIPYVARFPTDGHESIWGPVIHLANRFPHDSLQWESLPRKSVRAEDNLRRILSQWTRLRTQVTQEAKDNEH